MAPIPLNEIALRIAMAFLAGGLIGIERETRGRAAGFRTTLLVCVAAALTMIISQILYLETASSSWRPDPARLAAGLLAGMGFLGAGTIVRQSNFIRGVTTAATLWFVTIIGMSMGMGQFALGSIGLGVALVTLYILPALEARVPVDWYSKLIITLASDGMTDGQIKERIESFGLEIKNFELEYDLVRKQKTILCEVKLLRSDRFDLSQKVMADLATCPGVLQIKWL